MPHWFDALPVPRKLVVIAVAVSAMALLTIGTGLLLVDVWRYRANAQDDVTTLADIVAENVAEAVMSADARTAQKIVSSVRPRSAVTRACVYLPDGTLFTRYERSSSDVCPATSPRGWTLGHFGVSVPIIRDGRTWGSVYMERDLPNLGRPAAVTAAAAALTLALAIALSFTIARRLTRTISQPIAALAMAARQVGREPDYVVPHIATPEDEVGELVVAFRGMVARVKEANQGLLLEIDERKKVEAQREILLAREREASRLKDEFLAAAAHHGEARRAHHRQGGGQHLAERPRSGEGH